MNWIQKYKEHGIIQLIDQENCLYSFYDPRKSMVHDFISLNKSQTTGSKLQQASMDIFTQEEGVCLYLRRYNQILKIW